MPTLAGYIDDSNKIVQRRKYGKRDRERKRERERERERERDRERERGTSKEYRPQLRRGEQLRG